MNKYLNNHIKLLAKQLNTPLFIVGGSVRNFLLGYNITDIDICANICVEKLSDLAVKCGFLVGAVYKRTNTAKITDSSGISYEFTSLRQDIYNNSGHTPTSTVLTSDLIKDAKRRDFKCNAIYYEIIKGEIIDPLNGLKDIKNKVLSTVAEPDIVFKVDGLRILRLIRFSGELGFSPDRNALSCAIKNIDNLDYLSVERITAELNLCLTADLKYNVKDGHYICLKLLEKTQALYKIIPELKYAKNLKQPAKYHKYDVLWHSLMTAYYAPPDIRLAGLLHDIGKPFVYKKNGNFYNHDKAGEILCTKILTRLKYPKKVVEKASRLTALHMYDLNGLTSTKKIKLFILENYKYILPLLSLKQADYSASNDNIEKSRVVLKWENIYKEMVDSGTPFDIKSLKINGTHLQELGIFGENIAKILNLLLKKCVNEPKLNKLDVLKKLALEVKNE